MLLKMNSKPLKYTWDRKKRELSLSLKRFKGENGQSTNALANLNIKVEGKSPNTAMDSPWAKKTKKFTRKWKLNDNKVKCIWLIVI